MPLLANDYKSRFNSSRDNSTFGLNELQLQSRKTKYEKLELGFADDDRAIVDDYRDGKWQEGDYLWQ